MRSLNASFLAALEAGTGKPVFYITLYSYYSSAWHSQGNYDVIEARLSRLKQDIKVQENLVTDSLIASASGNPYAITVTRGLIVQGGTTYTITERKYFITKAEY